MVQIGDDFMKTLYLIRHAKSSWKDPVDDFERDLNKRGKKDLEFMPRLVKTKCKGVDLILASDAIRAKKTALAINEKFDAPIKFDNSIYQSSFENLLQIVHNLSNEYHTLCLVGHNPGLNMLAEYLWGNYIENIPTFGIFGLEFKTNHWSEVNKATGENILFEYPKKYK